MNWMIHEGLINYGRADLAEELRARTLNLVEHAGFSEYFSPLTGHGYGASVAFLEQGRLLARGSLTEVIAEHSVGAIDLVFAGAAPDLT